jgi:hypothetical protein
MLILLIPLILPFDSANIAMAGCLDVALPIVWQCIFTFVAFWIVFVIPFSISYYEAQRSYDACWKGFLRQCLCGLGFTIPVVVIFTIAIVVGYFLIGFADIDIISYSNSDFSNSLQAATLAVATCAGNVKKNYFNTTTVQSY